MLGDAAIHRMGKPETTTFCGTFGASIYNMRKRIYAHRGGTIQEEQAGLLTLRLLQYLHAIAVLCLGADWLKAICCGPPLP